MPDDAGYRRVSGEGTQITELGEALRKSAERTSATGEQFSLFADAPLPDDDRPGEPVPGRKGRPPGAKNRATEQFRAWVRATRGDPGLAIIDRIFADPIALSRTLGADSAWDVYKAQSDWLLRMLPYFWAAMPAELKVQAQGALAVAISGTPGEYAGGDRVIDLDPFAALVQFAQNQRVSAEAPADANDGQANGQGLLPLPSKG